MMRRKASKAFTPDSNRLRWIDQAHFVADFAADIPRDEAELMVISQVPVSTDAFTQKAVYSDHAETNGLAPEDKIFDQFTD